MGPPGVSVVMGFHCGRAVGTAASGVTAAIAAAGVELRPALPSCDAMAAAAASRAARPAATEAAAEAVAAELRAG